MQVLRGLGSAPSCGNYRQPHMTHNQRLHTPLCMGSSFTLLINRGAPAAPGHLSHHHSLQIFYFHLASLQANAINGTYILRNHFPEPGA